MRAERCKEPVAIAELGAVRALCMMYDNFATKANGVDKADGEGFHRMVELWFLFCLAWSIGGTVDDESRKNIDACMRELDAQIPHKDSVYEYFVDKANKKWVHWEEKLNASWKVRDARSPPLAGQPPPLSSESGGCGVRLEGGGGGLLPPPLPISRGQ